MNRTVVGDRRGHFYIRGRNWNLTIRLGHRNLDRGRRDKRLGRRGWGGRDNVQKNEPVLNQLLDGPKISKPATKDMQNQRQEDTAS